MRQKREEQKGRNRRLSSRKLNWSRRKKAEVRRTIRKEKSGSKHLRNSCGSESGKGERKQTGSVSTRTVKGCTRNQAKGSGEDVRIERRERALKKPLWGGFRKMWENQKQRLSSQNPKLKLTKESEKQRRKKVEVRRWKPRNGWPKEVERQRWVGGSNCRDWIRWKTKGNCR